MQMASCQMSPRLFRLLAGSVLGSTARDVTAPLLLMHLHISHLLNSLNSSLPSTSVPRSILPEREKNISFKHLFSNGALPKLGSVKAQKEILDAVP